MKFSFVKSALTNLIILHGLFAIAQTSSEIKTTETPATTEKTAQQDPSNFNKKN